MKIYKKILAVMSDIEYLKKDDHVKFGSTNYKAISEEKVTSAVRASLLKNGLVMFPIHQEHKRDGNLSTVDVTYRLADSDSAEYVDIVSSGTGADTQDKGVGKAMTYAYKYAMLRTFAIPTGEDPDKISSEELDAKQKKEEEKKNEIELCTSENMVELKALAIHKGTKLRDILQSLLDAGKASGKLYTAIDGGKVLSMADYNEAIRQLDGMENVG